MLSTWKQKLELRRQRKELELIQEQCPHEWHVVSEYELDVGDYELDWRPVWKPYADLYCPVCKKTRNKVSKINADKILKIQEVQQQFDSK